MKKKIFKIVIVSLAMFSTMQSAHAAILNLSTDKNSVKIGDTFQVQVKVDSESTGINAGQATITFPKDIVNVVSVDKTNSVFNFWLTEPAFSNDTGTVNFLGGSTSGLSGASLQIFTINFKVKSTGDVKIVFNDGAVTASDGTGSNVLSSMKSLDLQSVATQTATVILPVQIQRPAIPGTAIPVKAVIKIPLYPDPTIWYNLSSSFTANWDLPSDVTDVATTVDKLQNSNPSTSEGLFSSKTFSPLADGVWYLHVRFKNNLGWGTTNNYKIAIDTTPPPAFTADIKEGTPTENPSPTIEFPAFDQLSGIKQYLITLATGETLTTTSTFYKLPLLPPGKQAIKINAEDNAHNVRENIVNLEILPIQSPTIITLRKEAFTGEGGISLGGKGPLGSKILISLRRNDGSLILSKDTTVASTGDWESSIEDPLQAAQYYIEATAQDSTGARSFVIKSSTITVRERPLLTLFGLEISKTFFILFLVILLVGTFALGWYFNKLTSQRRRERAIIVERDVDAVLNTIKSDIKNVLVRFKGDTLDDREIMEAKSILNEVTANIEKMEKYLEKSIEEINS